MWMSSKFVRIARCGSAALFSFFSLLFSPLELSYRMRKSDRLNVEPETEVSDHVARWCCYARHDEKACMLPVQVPGY